jgi:hypothetical protein
VSAMHPAVIASNFFWRDSGLAFAHSMVTLRRRPFPNLGREDFVGVVGSSRLPLLWRDALSVVLRSLDDLECASALLSLSARALVGDLRVLGIASSSMVFPRDLKGVVVSVRLRIVMPWRCLNFRF